MPVLVPVWFDGNYTTMRDLANGVLELDGRVIDVELLAQPLLHAT